MTARYQFAARAQVNEWEPKTELRTDIGSYQAWYMIDGGPNLAASNRLIASCSFAVCK